MTLPNRRRKSFNNTLQQLMPRDSQMCATLFIFAIATDSKIPEPPGIFPLFRLAAADPLAKIFNYRSGA